MDIGAAYGIWNPEEPDFKAKRAKLEKDHPNLSLPISMAGSMIGAGLPMGGLDKDDKEKLVIDEDDDDEEEEPLSPGGPEDLPLPPTGVPLQGSQQQTPTPPNSNDQALNLDIDNESKPTNTSSTPMETSA